MKSKKNRVLITGSAGFIGFHVCKLFLEKNYNVVGVDNLNSYYDVKLKRNRTRYLKEYKNFKFFKADICNKMILKNIFKKNKFDKVINLAAQAGVRYSIKKPKAYLESNVDGFLNIGYFHTQSIVDNYWLLSGGTATRDDSKILDGVQISGSNYGVANSVEFTTSGSFALEKGVPYSITFNAYYYKEDSLDKDGNVSKVS